MNRLKQTLGPEFWVVITGIIMAVGLVSLIVYFAVVEPGKAKILGAAFITHSFGGRAAGVGLCIMAGINAFWNTTYNMYLEVMIVCFMYFLFVYTLTNHIKNPWMVSFTNNMLETANRNKGKIGKYGWIGLFLFVMAPLPFTGPVMGSIIGYLLGMVLWKNFSAVFLGTLSAIILWVACFEFLDKHLHMIQYALVVIVGIVLFFHLKTLKALFSKKNKGAPS